MDPFNLLHRNLSSCDCPFMCLKRYCVGLDMDVVVQLPLGVRKVIKIKIKKYPRAESKNKLLTFFY